ncbi:MAG TPA: APC family permease, partial [Anaeromyxobacteraceae bacterium]|nr:APC family permease [Anaeromyxobacteraceae bacterium]
CALLVGELAAALPVTGGYYSWVKSGLGMFWGLQEGWLSLAYSAFDIALYPTLFVTYLARIFPSLGRETYGQPGWLVAVGVIVACTAWNMAGIRSLGRGCTALALAILTPFAAIVLLALASLPRGGLTAAASAFRARPTADSGTFAAGLMLAMWNLTGFDNATTFAAEVRDPGRSYPRAVMCGAIGITVSYIVTVAAAATTGLAPAAWSSGSWVEVGARLGGPTLAWAVALGGAVSAFGMYNALLLAWSRLPVALAEDRWLPRALAHRSQRARAPTWSVLVGGAMSVLCVGLGLRRLVEIDIILYGAALALEFAALVALRVREPELARPFRVPGGTIGSVAMALPPMALLALAAWQARGEPAIAGMSAFGLSTAIAVVGIAWWAALRLFRRTHPAPEGAPPEPP